MTIQRSWHLYDANNQTLGRLATEVAALLMGKHKPGFMRHKDEGDYVVIVNVEKIGVTGNKERAKVYDRYSGYPSGRREIPLFMMRERKPEEIIYRAVKGMLPKNKLQDLVLKRLKLVVGDTNPYSDKFAN